MGPESISNPPLLTRNKCITDSQEFLSWQSRLYQREKYIYLSLVKLQNSRWF